MNLPLYKEQKSHPLASIKCIVAVAAGKGGVGKSTIAVNVALALQQLGYSVGLLDADLYGPSLRKMLPEETPPQQHENYILPARCYNGINMISMAYFRRESEAAIIRAPIANNIITQFMRQVKWGTLDFLLIDFPPGTGDIHLTLAQQANLTAALIVTTPQQIALLDVRKAMQMFRQLKIPLAGIIENMSYFVNPATGEHIPIFGCGGGEALAKEWNIPLLGKIPLDPALCHACDNGLSQVAGNNSTSEIFLTVAQYFAEQFAYLSRNKNLNNFELIWKEMHPHEPQHSHVCH